MLLTVYSFPLLDIFLTMLIIAGLFLWVVLLVMVFSDVFHRHFSGPKKSFWAVVVLVLPLIGALIYIAAEGRGMSGRGLERQQAMGVQYASPEPINRLEDPDALTHLIVQRDAGSITEEEYEVAKSAFFDHGH
jgi:hypothetical protein